MFSKVTTHLEKWTSPRSPSYDLIEPSDSEPQARQAPQLEDRKASCRQCAPGASFLWILSTFVLAFLLAFSTWRQYTQPRWSYEKGFRTDFAAARSAISIEEVRFTSGVWIDANGTFNLAEHAGVPTYVGPPSPEIDKEWDLITEPEWFHATEEEIKEYGGNELAERLSRSVDGIYPAELDVFHSLHCLNQLRKAIDREYYHPSYGPRNEKYVNYMHWDHCVDQLRQVLQCHGDTTMNGAIWYPGGGKNFVDTEDTHTCRNFTKLREWGRRRSALQITRSYLEKRVCFE